MKIDKRKRINVIKDDCLVAMRKLKKKSVDLIVIDPPYNIGKDKSWDKWKTVDGYVQFMGEVFKECKTKNELIKYLQKLITPTNKICKIIK